ncbi:MAG: flagellar basal body P-ring protein FlgI [Thermoguttaceae bacterium]|nr:flagellar basal body P-ring protein FlgI [Thermoguttaceae bacterium]MDW8079065.1 flagellar basal body P-ring protein FlgI [Thermoguttaceae bacterium]
MQRVGIVAAICLCLAAFVWESCQNQSCCRFPSPGVVLAQEVGSSSGEAAPAQPAGSQASASNQSPAAGASTASEGQPQPSQVESAPPSQPPAMAPAAGQPAAPSAESQPPAAPAPATPPATTGAPSETAPKVETQTPPKEAPSAEAQPPASAREAPRPSLAELLAKLRPQEPEKFKKVGDICQVKVHRIETLHGFGLVVDIAELARAVGTSARATTGAPPLLGQVIKPSPLSTAGEPLSRRESSPAADLKLVFSLLDQAPADDPFAVVPESLWERRAVTLVAVTVNIPQEGAHKGDRLDCQLRSFETRSLSGGFLLPTKLYPPGPREGQPLGIAAGPIVSETTLRAAGDRVVGGCLIQADIAEQFLQDGKLRLILRQEYADFLTAQDIADRINVELGLLAGKPLAKALGATAIEVELPAGFEPNPVGFVTQILRLPTNVPLEETPIRPTPRPALPSTPR